MTCTEVVVELHRPPQLVFAEYEELPRDTNYVRFRLNPDMQIAIGARAKQPGDGFIGENVELYLCEDGEDRMTPYERLLGDAMEGENLLFAREDGVEAAWRVVDPVLTDHAAAMPYEPHTWGPDEAEAFIGSADGWRSPTPPGPPTPR